jgi:hypothetical protein
VFQEPYTNKDALERVASIRTEQLKAPAGFGCASCFARVACLGGCHCQYVGQDGLDPANRHDVARGFCESYKAAMTGMVRAGWRNRWTSQTAARGRCTLTPSNGLTVAQGVGSMREANRSAVTSIIRLAAQLAHASRDARGRGAHATSWLVRANGHADPRVSSAPTEAV